MNAEEKVEFVRRAIEPAMAAGPRTLLDRYDEVFTDDYRWTPLITSIEGGGDMISSAETHLTWADAEAAANA